MDVVIVGFLYQSARQMKHTQTPKCNTAVGCERDADTWVEFGGVTNKQVRGEREEAEKVCSTLHIDDVKLIFELEK